MLFLVLGKGKTGSLVAEVARERGHGVRVLDLRENRGAASITAPTLAGVDAVIDFTNAESAVQNIRAVLALGGRIVVGTTGWYAALDGLRSKTSRGGALLYGTNFSIGVQKLFRLTEELAKLDGYTFSITETHHTTKLDAPSGTAVTLQEILSAAHPGVEIPITSHREGDASGEHVVTAKSDVDLIELRHDTSSRRGFALGAVRAAEWLAQQKKSGVWDFREIFEQL
jgi:4-hydroxy-tetrahydrodipicolinate reductase